MRAVTLAGYGLLVCAALVIAIAARRGRDRLVGPGRCLAFIMRTPAGRWGVLLAWVWLGWHLFVR